MLEVESSHNWQYQHHDHQTTERGVEDSRRFFEKLCDFNSTTSSMPANMSSTCLFSLPAEDLVKETLAALAAWGKPMEERIQMEKTDPSFLGYAFWLVVDDFSDNPFLPSHPITILHNQQQKMVPFMTGVTTEEGAILAPSIWKDMEPTKNVVKDNWGWVGTSTLFQSETHHRTYDLELQARMVAHFYMGKDGLVRENKQGLMDMITDTLFAAPNHETIKLHAKVPPHMTTLLTYVFLPGPATGLQLPLLLQRILLLFHILRLWQSQPDQGGEVIKG